MVETGKHLTLFNELQLQPTRQAHGIVIVFTNLIRWGALLGIARYGYLSILALSGQKTIADIGLRVIANVQVGKYLAQSLAWIFGGSGILYGLGQRRLRRKTIERLAPKAIEREQMIDPNRSSSRLTSSGGTHPEDE